MEKLRVDQEFEGTERGLLSFWFPVKQLQAYMGQEGQKNRLIQRGRMQEGKAGGRMTGLGREVFNSRVLV